MTGIGDRNNGSKGPRSMRACHLAVASNAIVVGGKAIFRADRNSIRKQENKKKGGTPHGQKARIGKTAKQASDGNKVPMKERIPPEPSEKPESMQEFVPGEALS
jgi:hypothetical protein